MIKSIEELKFASDIIGSKKYNDAIEFLIAGEIKELHIKDLSIEFLEKILSHNNETKKIFEILKKEKCSIIIGMNIEHQEKTRYKMALEFLLEKLEMLFIIFNKIENINHEIKDDIFEVNIDKYSLCFSIMKEQNKISFHPPITNRYRIHSVYNKELKIKNEFNTVMKFKNFVNFINNREETFCWNQDTLDMINFN